MNTFKCPKSHQIHDISKLEMWGLYEDGAETEFTCTNCDTDLIITSTAIEWSFDIEIND